MSSPEKPGRLEAHNKAYADKFAIPAEQVQASALNPDWFVKPIEVPSHEEIVPGVILSKEKYTLPDGDFTNIYDVCVRPGSPAKIKLVSFAKPKKPTHIFRDELNASVIENATFFYIVDDTDPIAKKGPPDGTLNWCMRDGKVVGLPVADRPALFEIKGELTGKTVIARGEILVGDTKIDWVGGQSIMHAPVEQWAELYKPEQATVFNAACIAVVKEQDNPHGLRMLEKETYFTPQDPSVTALAVSYAQDGSLRVTSTKEGGGMGLFEGNFILQVPTSLVRSANLKEGTVVVPQTLDGIDLTQVNSALTMGPSVMEYLVDQENRPIDLDRSFGTPPPFTDKRYARSIIFKDGDGIHLRIYDAVPASSHFKGMTPREVAESLSKDTEWAFFCDGGQSSIIGTRTAGKAPEFYGNLHYAMGKQSFMAARATGNVAPERSMLLGRNRPLPSAIVITYDPADTNL